MSAATLLGAALAYPVNVWLVARRLKHGMGTVRALGKGGHSVNAERTRGCDAAHHPRMGVAVGVAAQIGDLGTRPLGA